MEARNFITAREMVQGHNWIFTTINGLPRYEKPPLPTWITAFSGLIFGFKSLFAMRLPVVLITLLLVYFFYRLCRIMQYGREKSLVAGLILISSFYIFFSGRDNQWDMYCHSFMVGCIFYCWRIFSSNAKTWRNVLWASLFFGCSFLSKGPISLYTLFLPFLVAYAVVYHIPKNKIWPLVVVILMGLVIGLSWPIYVRIADAAAFLEITNKEVGRWNNYNTKPFFYYWSFFLQSGIWALPALGSFLLPFLQKTKMGPQQKFALFWTLGSLLLLSIVPEKKVRYLLPVLIPLALCTGFFLRFLWQNYLPAAAKKMKVLIRSIFGINILIAFAFPIAFYILAKDKLGGYWLWYILLSVALLLCAAQIFSGLRKYVFSKVFAGTVLMVVALSLFGYPLYNIFKIQQGTMTVSDVKVLAVQKQLPVLDLDEFTPEMVWKYGAPIPQLDTLSKNNEASFVLLCMTQDTMNLRSILPRKQLQNIGQLDLNRMKAGTKGYSNRLQRWVYKIQPAN